MNKLITKLLLGIMLVLGSIIAKAQVTQSFTYTGANQTFTVPAGVTSITVKMWGAGGAGASTGGSGGSGAFLKGTMAVTPGQSLIIVVGGGGVYNGSAATAATFGGGGAGGGAHNTSGGGYSGIFSSSVSQANALGIAAGGGGGGYYGSSSYGGGGGATTGSDGGLAITGYTGGAGATVSAGGIGGSGSGATTGSTGSALAGGTGGINTTNGGAGGGGGYFGGGGGYGHPTSTGYSSGGGGGSSFLGTMTGTTNIAGTISSSGATTQAPGSAESGYVTGVGNGGTSTGGAAGGNGLVTVSYCTSPVAAGTYSIGPTGNYTSITAAISALLGGCSAITGAYVYELQSTYVSTVETFPIVLPAINGASATNTITIRPATGATALSITSSNTTATLDLNGANYWIIDGQPGGTGGVKQLTIANTSTSGVAARFINDASNNTIKYCTVQGVNTSTTSGVVLFSTTTGTTGNDNNTIDRCDIRDGATTPANGIYASGTTTSTATNNSGNTISNSNIFNFFSAGSAENGILISSGNTDWTITGNSLYQTATRTETTAANDAGITISNSSGNNFTITNNYIGGGAASAGGTAWTIAGSIANRFRGISLSVGSTTASSIQGNTIANFNFTSNSSATSAGGPWVGIYLTAGNANIGNITANTIGSGTGTGSISITAVTNSGGISNGIYCDATSTVSNISNNVIGSVTMVSSSIGAGFTGITTTAGTTLTINGNTVGSTATANSINTAGYTGTTAVIVTGINNTSSATISISNNTIANLNNGYLPAATNSSSLLRGIVSTSGTNTITGNTVRNLSTAAQGTGTSSSASVIGISHSSSTAGLTLTGNTIRSLSNTHASAAVIVTGIFMSGPSSGASNIVGKNLIHTLTASSAASIINGIQDNGAFATYLNNMIDLGNGITVSAQINGINQTLGTDNFYHNSVYIGGSAVVSGTVNTFAFNSSQTVNTRNIRDNIFFNARSNTSGTGKHYAVKVSGTGTNPTGLTINNNIYFTNGVGSVFGFYNADVANLAAWQTATGQDANSFSSDPQYLDPTNATPDLHINPAITTYAEGNGVDVGVTDDYDGQTRSGLTPVDIGADAGNFTGTDLVGPVISYTAIASTCGASGAQTLTATITDALSGVPTSGVGLPTAYFKINAGAYTAATGTYVSGNTYTFSIGAGSVAGDVISYYVVAQDGAVTPNVSVFPSGGASGFSANPPAVSTPPATPSSFTNLVALSGTYNVGSGQTYTTLTAAIADYNSKCVTGPVVFQLMDASYSGSETFPITINANTYASITNTLTIRPATGVTATISGAAASGALLKLNGADYVTIDGSNSGGTDRSLTITNTATTAPTGVSLISLGTGAGATNNTIKNCNIGTGVQTSTGYGIAVGGSTPGSTGADNDNTTLQNNSISACVVGIYAQGTATVSTGGNDNLSITGNTISYNSNLGANVGINVNNSLTTTINQNTVSIATTVTSGLAYGMQLAGTTGATVNQNTINVSTAAATAPVGISLETNFVSSVVNKNLITGVTTSATNGYGGRGITVGTGTASSNVTLANNMIYGVTGSAFSSFGNSSPIGIAIGIIGSSSTLTTTTGGVNLYFNSVNMYGNHSYSSATITTALYVGSGASSLDIRNNIFANSLNNTTTSGSKNYCIYSAAANTAFTNINYNDYYPVSSANSTGFVGFLGSDQSAVTDWRTASAQDAQSISADPKFLSNTNLHINTAVITPIESAGTSIGAVSDDYDGDARAGTPDIGADEGTFIAPAANDISATAFVNPTNGGSKVLNVAFTPQASFTNTGTAAQTNITVRYRIVDATLVEVYNQTAVISSLASNAVTTITFPAATLTATGTYSIFAKAELAGDALPANDEITGSLNITDPYTSSTTTQNSSNVGVNTTNQQVIGIQVVVSGTSATLTSLDFNTNGTTAPATDITNAKIFYTGATSTFSASTQFGTTVAAPNGSHTVTGSQALVNGTNYFWLTYDVPSGATPANVIDAECSSITVNGVARTPTVTAPAGSRTIVGPMSGTYLVGASQTAPNYVNLTSALAELNFRGVSAAVVFELQSDYNSAGETFPITVNAFTGASAVNTLTIKPGSGVTASISGNNTLSILTLNGADYVVVDGSNAGTTSRNLTISNTNTGTSGSIVSVVSASASNGATNNTIKNCILTGNANNTTLAGVFGGAADGFSNALIANSNNTIQNNQISLVEEGIYIGGYAGAPMDDNWLITQNVISNIGFDGLWLNNMQNYTVSNNSISSVSLNANPAVTGIVLESAHSGGTVTKNLISGIKNTTTRGAYGIQLGATTTASNITVSNNFIYDVTGSGQATLARNGFGIYASSGGGYNIYFNTVHLNTNQSTTTGTTAAMLISGVTTAASLDIRNNIFANTQTTGAAAATRYSIYSANANTIFSAIDNNDYYTTGTSLGFLGSNQATLANVQTAFGSNLNAISLLPAFVSATDMHLTTASGNYPLKAGTTIAGITTDYDVQVRNVTVPAIGADEIYVPGFWTGAASTVWDGTLTGNWDDNAIPTSGADIVIPAGVSNSPVLTGVSPTIGKLNIGSGKSVSLNGNTLTVNGSISGVGTISGSATSGLTIGGTAGTINFTSGSRSLNNLTMNSGASATLGTSLDVYGTIALTTASLNLNAQHLTLKSNSTNTARIADLTGSTLSGATNVTMERYIKLRAGGDGRAYRLLTPTVNTTGSINANWMEGGLNTAIGTNVDPVPGYGTQITGSGGNANGFDKTQTNAASLYNTSNGVTPGYTAVTSTAGTMNAKTGYFMYVRGDRNQDMTIPLAPNMPTSATTLRATGSVITGTQTSFTNAFTGGGALNLVTNPYPSPIDWSLVKAASSNITDFYTFWDPNFGTRGGFVTVSSAGVASSGLATQFIQSGQAFFVESDGGVPAVSIQEGHKAAGNNNDVFLTPPPPVEAFRTELYFTEPNGFRRVVDGAIALYDNSYSAAVDKQDGKEVNNWDENIAYNRDGKHLAIEARPVIEKSDDLPIFMNNMKKQTYEFEFTPAVFTNTNLKAELVDNFLGTRTLLSVINPTVVSFSITDDPASKASDRFKVVFGAFGNPQGVDAITIKAAQQNNGVQVDWASKTETDMLKYEVEKSSYGTSFTKVNTTTALGNSTSPVNYNWFDANPNTGTSFYRIKGTDKAGNVRYSESVRVLYGKGEPAIVVYPNPVQGTTFKMDMYNLVKGTYVLSLYNNSGQLVYTEQIQHDGSQATKTINIKGETGKGVYQLQLIGGNGFKTTQRIIKN